MKTIEVVFTIFLIAFISFAVFVFLEDEDKRKCDVKESIEYNIEKDSMINAILDQDPIFAATTDYDNLSITVLRYEQLKITVYHRKAVPYEQVENWSFSCIDKEGKMIIIDSRLSIPEHKVSPATLNRIKEMHFELNNSNGT